MHIAFRVDASIDIGSGHVMRCLTLADELQDRGALCTFICRAHLGNLQATISQRGYKVLSPPPFQENALNLKVKRHVDWLGTCWSTDAQDTQKLIRAIRGNEILDWLVVDHYAIDRNWEKTVRPLSRRTLVIDDLSDRPHVCDILLDQNLGRESADYSGLLEENTKLLIGPNFALLRSDFKNLRESSVSRRLNYPRFQRLLVSMGGVDKDNVTSEVLCALAECRLPSDLIITVVMGSHSPWLNEVKARAAQMRCTTDVLVGVTDMASLMAECDLAIGAAGGTAWERCCLGLPSVLLVLAQNQLFGSKALQQREAAILLDSVVQLREIFFDSKSTIFSKEFLPKMSRAAMEITDGLGCARVADAMTSCFND